MQKSFLFDLNKCTGCGACVIACSIERSLNAAGESACESPIRLRKNWRQVHTFNESCHPALPVFNLSLACNHCVDPVCLRNCPARAYSKDEATGAVTIDPAKCMGCKYCTWACPYDAPKYEPGLGITRKCDFCKKRIDEGREPACVSACPMGALQFSELENSNDLASGGQLFEKSRTKTSVEKKKRTAGFTDAGIEPAINFIPLRRDKQPEFTAPPTSGSIDKLFEFSLEVPVSKITLKAEWALLLFTTAAYILVAFFTALLTTGPAVNPFLFLGTGAAAMGLSFVHLGKKFRAYRAIFNWRSSWLSREILFFSAFMGLSGIYLLFFPGSAALGWAAAGIGFFSLFAVDKIYQVAMQSGPLNFHSAHVLFNGFFLLGFLVKNSILFGFFGIIKFLLYLHRKYRFKKSGWNIRPLISMLRLGLGFLFPLALFILDLQNNNICALSTVGIIIGEFIDRGEYYDELDVITPQKQLLKDLKDMLIERSSEFKSTDS
ncbi:MAG: 4Fe-4S binding protein [Candidatus Aminicenantes bacterium]|nr:4Fe-4S binding protein [Candidatus Aminicenantes bacterium]